MLGFNLLTLLFAAFFSRLASCQLSPECSHPDQDYAWNEMEELVQLDEQYGILVTDSKGRWSCLEDVDSHNMIAYPAEPEHICHQVLKVLTSLPQLKNVIVRVMIPFNRSLYYATDKGVQPPLQLPSSLPELNYKFNMPDIAKWFEVNVAWHQVDGVVLLRTAKNFPRYPSAIITLQDPKYGRIFEYRYTNPTNLMEAGSFEVGYFPFPIKALFTKRRKYRPTVELVIAFEKYYARIKLPIKEKQENNKIFAFPVLPIQGFFGCPVHLCWWPVLDDALYYNSAYYFFQGRWMFRVEEGQPKPDAFRAEQVYDLTTFGISFTVHAAFYDLSLGHLIFIQLTNEEIPKLVPVTILAKGSSGRIQVKVDKTPDVELVKTVEGRRIIAATHINSTNGPPLWILFRTIEEKLLIQGYGLVHSSSGRPHLYTVQVKIDGKSIVHKSISSLFYHYPSGHLYLTSGFYLYIYEEANLQGLTTSRCSVTTVAHYFNCTDSYYNMNRMEGKSKGKFFGSKDEYFNRTRHYHEGDFLPGKCNFFSNMPLDRIPFTEKIHDQPPATGRPWFKAVYGWMVIAIIAGIVIAAATYYARNVLQLRFQQRQLNRAGEQERQVGEAKLMAFLKGNFIKGPTPARDSLTVTSSSTMSSPQASSYGSISLCKKKATPTSCPAGRRKKKKKSRHNKK